MRFIADDEHPSSTQWDNGADPVAELAHVLEVRDIALKRFGLNNIPKGAPVADLRRVFVPVYLFHRYQVDAVVKQVGGVDYGYPVSGGGLEQAKPIPAADQRRALKALSQTLAPERLDVPDELSGLLSQGQAATPDRQFEIEVFETQGGPVFDPMGAAVVASDMTLRQLVEAPRLNRVLEQHRRDPGQVSVDELLSWLFGAVQAQADDPPRFAEIRRREQARLVGDLVDVLGDKTLSPTAAGLVEQGLKAFAAALDTSKGTPEAVAFNRRLADLVGKGDREALKLLASDVAPAPRQPPGSPIGEDCWFCSPLAPPAD